MWNPKITIIEAKGGYAAAGAATENGLSVLKDVKDANVDKTKKR